MSGRLVGFKDSILQHQVGPQRRADPLRDASPSPLTTDVAGAIVGVGAARKVAGVRWNVASKVVVAWFVTLPAAAAFSATFYGLYTFLS